MPCMMHHLKTVCPLLLTSQPVYAFWHTWFAPQNLPYSATFSLAMLSCRPMKLSSRLLTNCQVCPSTARPSHVPVTHPLHARARAWQASADAFTDLSCRCRPVMPTPAGMTPPCKYAMQRIERLGLPTAWMGLPLTRAPPTN